MKINFSNDFVQQPIFIQTIMEGGKTRYSKSGATTVVFVQQPIFLQTFMDIGRNHISD